MFTTLTLTGTVLVVKAIKQEYSQYAPFVRLGRHTKSSGIDQAISGFSFYPEIIFVALVILSAKFWNYQISTLLGVIVFGLWCVIMLLLFTLALTNAKTLLLPDALIKPLGLVVIIFVLTSAIMTHNASLIGSSVVGGLLLGGVPYVLFQVSSGRWIGGGDVKMGFVAGLLLGWKYALLCIGLMIFLIGLSFFAEYVAGKLSKSGSLSRITTGTLWAVSVITCILLSR